VFIPNYLDPTTHIRGPATIPLCLVRGDLWDHQSGQIIHADTSAGCVKDERGNCIAVTGCIVHRDCDKPNSHEVRARYPIGVYKYIDREVKNGFMYFYSVTAFDSTTTLGRTTQLGGRRSAVESEGVVPQSSARTGKGVWVV